MYYITSYKGFRMSIWVRYNSITIDKKHLCGYVELTKDEYNKLSNKSKSNNVIDKINMLNLTYGELNKDYLLENDDRYVTIGIDLLSPYYIKNGLYMEPKETIKELQFIVDTIIEKIGSRTEDTCKEIDVDLVCQLSDDYEYPVEIISNRAKAYFSNIDLEYVYKTEEKE